MASFVVAALVGVWFFVSARKLGKQPFLWVAIGAVLFAGVATLVANLAFGLASPISVDDLPTVGAIALLSGFGLATLATVLVYRKYLRAAP